MLSALDLARRIEAGEITPAAVLDKCAEVIAAREGEIGAFIALDLDAAQRRAQDPAVATGPLAGLPVGVKDILDTVDFPTGYGTTVTGSDSPFTAPRAWARRVYVASEGVRVTLNVTLSPFIGCVSRRMQFKPPALQTLSSTEPLKESGLVSMSRAVTVTSKGTPSRGFAVATATLSCGSVTRMIPLEVAAPPMSLTALSV